MIIYPIDNTVIEQNSNRKLKSSMIFLGGPILGSTNWHLDAIKYMENRTEAHIASPRHSNVTSDDCHQAGSLKENYSQQELIEWQRAHLLYSYAEGCVMFWFPKEQEGFRSHPYSQTFLFELGYLLGRGRYSTGTIVIGIENGFPNAEYFRLNIPQLYPYIQHEDICSTLDATCDLAITKAYDPVLHRSKY